MVVAHYITCTNTKKQASRRVLRFMASLQSGECDSKAKVTVLFSCTVVKVNGF